MGGGGGEIRSRVRTRPQIIAPSLSLPRPHASLRNRMSLRVPFLSLVPGEDASAVREAIDRVIARGWFILGPEVEAFEAEFADVVRRSAFSRRRHRHRRPGTRASSDWRWSWRRSHHVTAFGGLLGAGHHDGGRHAGVCGHRSAAIDDGPGGDGCGGDLAHRRDHAGAPLRPAGRHDRDHEDCRAPQSRGRRRRVSGAFCSVRRTPDRHVRHRRRIQFLSDEESRRTR